MPKKSAGPIRELRVVFDTNPMFTQVPSELVNNETRNLIKTNSNHLDLQIAWHVPEVVILERHHQMLDQAQQLLSGFQKINAILGLNVTLTREQLSPKIASVVDSELLTLNLRRLQIDSSRVNWNEIIRNAAFRIPPFETGKTEKGFRDAMVLEAFMQLVESAPTSPARCRIALVTSDTLLTIATKARITGHANAEVLAGLEELRNLINTLISTVDEAFIMELREKATKLFFTPGDKSTLYYREDIRSQIDAKYAVRLKELPDGASGRDNLGALVAASRFIKKDRQRVHWTTQVRIKASAYKFTSRTSATQEVSGGANLGDIFVYSSAPDKNYIGGLNPAPSSFMSPIPTAGAQYPILSTGGTSYSPIQTTGGAWATVIPDTSITKTEVKKGLAIFDVVWSATIGRHRKLVRPTIDDIAYVETTWEE